MVVIDLASKRGDFKKNIATLEAHFELSVFDQVASTLTFLS